MKKERNISSTSYSQGKEWCESMKGYEDYQYPLRGLRNTTNIAKGADEDYSQYYDHSLPTLDLDEFMKETQDKYGNPYPGEGSYIGDDGGWVRYNTQNIKNKQSDRWADYYSDWKGNPYWKKLDNGAYIDEKGYVRGDDYGYMWRTDISGKRYRIRYDLNTGEQFMVYE